MFSFSKCVIPPSAKKKGTRKKEGELLKSMKKVYSAPGAGCPLLMSFHKHFVHLSGWWGGWTAYWTAAWSLGQFLSGTPNSLNMYDDPIHFLCLSMPTCSVEQQAEIYKFHEANLMLEMSSKFSLFVSIIHHCLSRCYFFASVKITTPTSALLPKCLLTSKWTPPLGTVFVWPKPPGLSGLCISLLAQTRHSQFDSSVSKSLAGCKPSPLIVWWSCVWAGSLEKCVNSPSPSSHNSSSRVAAAIFIYSAFVHVNVA